MGADDRHRAPSLEAAGFEVRVPALSRRKPTPGSAAVRRAGRRHGRRRPPAEQRALVGGVRRRRADRGRRSPASPPRPARSCGRAAGGSSSTRPTSRRPRPRSPSGRRRRSSPAPRSCATPSASRARRSAGGVIVEGSGWATDLLEQGASRSRPSRSTSPEGFVGELRSYQAEALAWLGFLDAVELGGCLALDMGLGKTPTVLAHLARTTGNGPALVIAPPAVVGNWAAEAARFTPELRVVVHHGASRASADELEAEVAGADIVITTYGTAVRDVDALAAAHVGPARARRGAGDQEPGQRDRPAAAPHPGRGPARPHRHADRERPRRPVGDPRLHQSRASSAPGRRSSPSSRARARPPCGR